MSDMMPIEQAEFIGTIASYVDDTTNYGTERATQFAFEIWQNRRFLTEYLGKQIRADAIDEYNKKLNTSMDTLEEKLKDKEIRNLEDVTLSIRCGMNLLAEQLKEQK